MGPAKQRNLCDPFRKPVLNRGTNKTETRPFVDDNDVQQGTEGNGRERGTEWGETRGGGDERVSHKEPAKRKKIRK